MRIFPPRWIPGLALAIGIAAIMPACSDDPATPPPPQGQKFEDLTSRADVLNNIELAYNQRNIGQYEKVMDANFTFYLSPGDVYGGLPEKWGRAEDLLYNQHLLDVNFAGPAPRCMSVEMDLFWGDALTWVEIPAPGAPGEKWYTTTVYYNFKFEMNTNYTYLNNPGSKVQFTVRNAGSEAALHWQLVEMRDLGGAQALRANAGAEQLVQAVTWGEVKALYR